MQAMPRTIFANIRRPDLQGLLSPVSHSWVRDRRLRSTSHVEPTGGIGISSLSFWISHMRCHSISRARKKSSARLKLFAKCSLWKDSLGRVRSKQPSPGIP